VEKQEMIKQWAQVAEAFGSSQPYNSSRSIREPLDGKQLKTSKVCTFTSNSRITYDIHMIILLIWSSFFPMDSEEQGEEDGEGGLLGPVAVARRRSPAPAEPRAADPASWPPVVVPQR
jgi:hypothetical protein